MIELNEVKDYSTIILPKITGKEDEMRKKYGEKAVGGLIEGLKNGVVPGGGATYLILAEKMRAEAKRVGKRESFAMEAFANALEDLFKELAFNSGLDRDLALTEAKACLSEGRFCGVDPGKGLIEEPTLTPYTTLRSALLGASETVISLLRIDDALSAKPLVKGKSSSGVTIYTGTGCPHCMSAKAYLRSKGVGFIEKNASADPAAAQEMIAKSGQSGTPVLDIRGNIVVGFDKARIDLFL